MLLLHQAVSSPGGGPAAGDGSSGSNIVYLALLRCVMLLAPLYCVYRIATAARLRAAAQEAHDARAAAVAAALGGGAPAWAGLLAAPRPQPRLQVLSPPPLPQRADVMHGPQLAVMMHEVR